ncbi:hypothetical protein EVAR_94690_1 [Eumeta japonica]|uniref:Uncharacterized protein n=1 Tax=Eumeta variegata TaxID=151549 RepID=A0A4C1UWA1_EUMVA|nr:hypothetical protein EVAR_94690_1 [Eumeta japonica]
MVIFRYVKKFIRTTTGQVRGLLVGLREPPRKEKVPVSILITDSAPRSVPRSVHRGARKEVGSGPITATMTARRAGVYIGIQKIVGGYSQCRERKSQTDWRTPAPRTTCTINTYRPQNERLDSDTVQRTKFCRSELPANDATRRKKASRSYLFIALWEVRDNGLGGGATKSDTTSDRLDNSHLLQSPSRSNAFWALRVSSKIPSSPPGEYLNRFRSPRLRLRRATNEVSMNRKK